MTVNTLMSKKRKKKSLLKFREIVDEAMNESSGIGYSNEFADFRRALRTGSDEILYYGWEAYKIKVAIPRLITVDQIWRP